MILHPNRRSINGLFPARVLALSRGFHYCKKVMFTYKPCEVPDCSNPSVSFHKRCFRHIEDKDTYRKELLEFLSEGTAFSDLSLAGVELENCDLPSKTFVLCGFSHARFRNVTFSGSAFRICFFDFAFFEKCSLTCLEVQNSVYAGTVINDCDFSGSNLIQVNFNNIECGNTSFNGSDLYNSRFIDSRLADVTFVDCNLKNVNFHSSALNRVNFKYSNEEDAFFDEKKVMP